MSYPTGDNYEPLMFARQAFAAYTVNADQAANLTDDEQLQLNAARFNADQQHRLDAASCAALLSIAEDVQALRELLEVQVDRERQR